MCYVQLGMFQLPWVYQEAKTKSGARGRQNFTHVVSFTRMEEWVRLPKRIKNTASLGSQDTGDWR